MKLRQGSPKSVILSGAKACPELAEGDPIPTCVTPTSARNFYHALALTDCVLLPAQRFSNGERPQ